MEETKNANLDETKLNNVGGGSARAYGPRIDTWACISCGLCRDACDAGIIHTDGYQYSIAADDCSFCQRCLEVCPVDAIHF